MESNLKGVSFIHRLRKRLSLQRRGFDCSTVRGITKWGGETKPTCPQREIAPDARRAIIVPEINLAKGLHETELVKILCGGRAESKFSPLYRPLKGWKKPLYVNTVFNPTKNLGGEFIRRNFGYLLPSGKVAVDTTHNESSWVPKG